MIKTTSTVHCDSCGKQIEPFINREQKDLVTITVQYNKIQYKKAFDICNNCFDSKLKPILGV